MNRGSAATKAGTGLARAYALLREGKLSEAEITCREILGISPQDAAATHLLGLIRNDAGDAVGAEALLARSIEIAPFSSEFRANLANMQRRLGRLQEAERSYRAALELDASHGPARIGLVRTLSDQGQLTAAEAECRALVDCDRNQPQPWSLLAGILRRQGRFADAENAYRQAIAIAPQDATTRHNLGSLLAQLERSEESLDALDRARALGLSGFELAFNRGRALVQLGQLDQAERAFVEAVKHNPRHVEAQLNLARLRFMRGDAAFARDVTAAAAAHRTDAALQKLLAIVLRRVNDYGGAEGVLRDVLARLGPDPEARSALAQVLLETGRLREAEFEAIEAAAARPDDPAIVETLVVILLARGLAADAAAIVRTQRSHSPLDQGWIAYEATAARLLGQPGYRELFDYRRLVRTYQLEAPQGWTSIEELNAALLQALNARHCLAAHPLDQSLRNGTQTTRSLLTDPDPAIRSIMKAFQGPIESYRQSMGTDAGHPLSARNSGPTHLTGAWSVQLRREGYHVNHFHPQGWISSAYYVSVPDEVNDLDRMSGWIKFGETRFPVAGALPETFVKPFPGRLVLFPSYMWHGTNPIHGTEPRTAIAFDAVPGVPD